MSRAFIELKNLSLKRQEQQILDSITLSINKGDFIVLVGPNGSGKSTLVKILNGLIKPDEGEIFIDSLKISGLSVFEIAKNVSTLTQDLKNTSFSELSVVENMKLALSRNLPLAKKLQRPEEMTSYLQAFNQDLGQKLHVSVENLSGGQRQALALAMCFAHHPDLLLLDEHTSALDPKASDKLMRLTNEHIKAENMTSIMITHSPEHALKYGNRLIALNEGRIYVDLKSHEKSMLTKNELLDLAY